MKVLSAFIGFFFLVSCVSTPPQDAPPAADNRSAYERLSLNEQQTVDAILDEFKRHHLYFLPELSEVQRLTAATTRGEVGDHDHGVNDDYQDEHLDIRVVEAFPDANGQYHTPQIQLAPNIMYTYETLYTVSVKGKTVAVQATAIQENTPERVPADPDPVFMQNLAARLKGTAAGSGKISLP